MTHPISRTEESTRTAPSVRFGPGWFDWENQDIVPFRWMGREADLRVSGLGPSGTYCLAILVRHLFVDQPSPRLEAFVDGRSLGPAVVPGRFTTLLFPFTSVGEASFSLRLDRAYDDPAGGRSLGVMVRSVEVISSETQESPIYGAGWYGWETEGAASFHWLARRGEILLPRKQVRSHRYLTFPLFLGLHETDQTLTLSFEGRTVAAWPIIEGWGYYSFDLAPVRDRERPESGLPPVLELSLNKLLPVAYHAGDGRELGARFGPLEFHDDDSWHAESAFFRENARKNYEEMKAGQTVLSSFPMHLGIDLFGRCNIHPPCVYCTWDEMKDLEAGLIEAVVDDSTLKGYGPFFWSARTLVNCSFGEPLLHPRLGEILDLFAERKKSVELSSNGQAFTERTIRALVGRQVNLYVSLDAGRRETYAKIRNDRWDGIVAWLVRLNEERRKAGRLPRIFLVFIPLRVNAADLKDLFRLAARIEADKVVLRPLQFPARPRAPLERGGYRFDFAREPLSRKELEALFRKAERYSRRYGIEVASQFDFGKPAPPAAGEGAGA
ncbi:MAG: radical SAM protein [Acidobacteriota bacterium]|nr:radical SAM protein [Acidobacteriota bacterium]